MHRELTLRKKYPSPHRGIEPALAVCRSDALPTELHPLPRTTVHYTTPQRHCNRLHNATLHDTIPKTTALHIATLHCSDTSHENAALHYTTPGYRILCCTHNKTTLHNASLLYTKPTYTTQRYTTLHKANLHYATLHYSTQSQTTLRNAIS